jgi:hypothetical protein
MSACISSELTRDIKILHYSFSTSCFYLFGMYKQVLPRVAFVEQSNCLLFLNDYILISNIFNFVNIIYMYFNLYDNLFYWHDFFVGE